ncbi:hypothetical protein RSOLAG22IIIB_04988 [Rhizoctonia solani]|uniref:Uncharacterized protein n=1 Tax=Rhizoctonia solani TaxID=456999 RepID=A0A0K6G2S4_9AGAM|nr:hypothetical protein RSOLAG22IIIB_04988 [Rhizoctonia solani]
MHEHLPPVQGHSTQPRFLMPASLQVAVHVSHHHSFYPPMEPTFIPQTYMVESDSDMDSEPHLSETHTETENDTPPETPLRATMGVDHLTKCETKHIEDSSCVRTPMMPAPPHFSEPLHLATPNPIRPVPRAIRSFGCMGLDEDDRGYDSEREGRPGLPRFRSFQSPGVTPDKANAKKPGLPRRATSFAIRRSGEEASIPSLSSSPRLHQPSPLPVLDTNIPAPDWATDLPTLEEIFGHPLSPEEQVQLLSDLLLSPLDDFEFPAPVLSPKDRSNEATGLGLGFPVSLEGDTWRIPTVVPGHFPIDSSPPQSADTPGISPVLCDDSDLSPLSLPLPLVSPAMTDWSQWDVFTEVDNRILYALETGTWGDEALAGINSI